MRNQTETVDVIEAGRRLGVGRATAYKLAKSGNLGGVRVLRVGRKFRVPVRGLERVLLGEEVA